MSLLFNMLSRFVIAFLPRNNRHLILWLQSSSTVILEPKKIKFLTVSVFSPIYLPWSDGAECHDLSFSSVVFSASFSLSCLILIKGIFSSSLLSVIRLVSFAYLRLLIFSLAILIPAFASSSSAFLMIYSA